MRCPFCGFLDDKVIDSRVSRDGLVIRRRRECGECQKRFTTYERVEETLPMVVKKDGRRETFDRLKISMGMKKACEKLSVSMDHIEAFINELEADIQESGRKEIPSTDIGERVMNQLRKMHEVAYVRFASVYRQFKDITEFKREVETLFQSRVLKDHPEK
ncbi:MAG: transcriptional repressor NrdR [Deltaproteobacteria bacterium]|nr:transcriptional repressor NrdR [Deltaproteobacteria bacterium]MBF0507900.1 transcriptional repressor NrdR [Deltaproteobacteria bacterium]MBF0525275.1 transcriptional repressor NrdR [Deltaproteobacteria bacterium]